ncbi:DUF6082 family protein [Actinoallomurus sp. NPDC050550]|uniref:DUF6082 family protein n=1 Tax=Actinoallomurus sp. NPDC050550 TaxID=3154937 RepID=UPI0033E70CB6
MRQRIGNRRIRSTLTPVVLLLIILTAVALIGISPIALGVFHGATNKWERFSFIGQTYGAASAIVSVLALVGIVVTLSYQAREAKLAREETRRQAVGDLLKMAMEDPDLDECWGPVPSPDDPRTRKQLLYTNMIIAEWSLSFETRALPEVRLRAIANEMFQGRVGRHYWKSAREARLSTSANSRERRFHEILDEEYQRARLLATPSPPVRTTVKHPLGKKARLLWAGLGVASALLYRSLRSRS